MRSRWSIVVFALLLGAAGSVRAAEGPTKEPAPTKPSAPALDLEALEFESVSLLDPNDTNTLLPYLVDLPRSWEMRSWAKGLFLAISPAGQDPPKADQAQNPWVVAARVRQVIFPGAESAIAALKDNAAKATAWTLVSVEAHEFGSAHGLVAITDSGKGELQSRTMTVRVPLPKGTLDLVASAPAKDFATFRPLYERILLSLQPAPSE